GKKYQPKVTEKQRKKQIA
nr:Chain h, 60S ribosomal protein L35 [Saccharomyces cerevisiae BY4741]